MTYFDHALALTLAVIMPISGYLSFQRLVKRAQAGDPVNRVQLYESTIATHWTLCLLLAVLWFVNDRGFGMLGIRLQWTSGFWIAAALVIAAFGFLIAQLRQVQAASLDNIQKFRGQLGRLALMIPRNGSELGHFNRLSLTAGIVEEVLWRGFMIWYLSQYMTVSTAAILSTLGFGVAHAYQGIAHLPKITIVGALFTLLYLLSGSLWLPIILHAAVDLLQGRTAYYILRRSEIESPETTEFAAERASATD